MPNLFVAWKKWILSLLLSLWLMVGPSISSAQSSTDSLANWGPPEVRLDTSVFNLQQAYKNKEINPLAIDCARGLGLSIEFLNQLISSPSDVNPGQAGDVIHCITEKLVLTLQNENDPGQLPGYIIGDREAIGRLPDGKQLLVTCKNDPAMLQSARDSDSFWYLQSCFIHEMNDRLFKAQMRHFIEDSLFMVVFAVLVWKKVFKVTAAGRA